MQYWARIRELAEKASVPRAFRKGGGTDLGLQQKNGEDFFRSYAIWGIPGHFGPEALAQLMQDQGWQLHGKPSPPRSTKGPWRVHGKCPGDQTEWAYKYDMGGKTRHINVVPWRSNRRPEGESEQIAKTRWFTKDDEFEVDDVKPTVIDATQTQTSPEMEVDEGVKSTKRKDEPKDKLSPVKKAAKKKPCITGGIDGPLGTRVLNLGGQGDCAWRALAFLIAQTNAKWSKNENELAEKSESMGAALRAQAVTFLQVKDRSWEQSFCPDDRWTETTEGGKPAVNLEEFRDSVLGRPQRYICHLGLQAVASLKKINVLIWELADEGWVKVALVSPPIASDKTPTVHLALGQQHYFACVKHSKNYPKALAQIEVGGRWHLCQSRPRQRCH